MNRFWGIAILLGFGAFSVLGFLAFVHDGHNHALACLAGLNDESCPVSPFEWASFHLGFLKSFSVAVFAALVLLGLPILFGQFTGAGFGPSASLAAFAKPTRPLVPISRFKNWQWLSLHIASPSF
jgi:hypothetical protein